ncbi:Uncharacterised protein [Xylophilus ampelinus]|nr:Uncharacterised protein [Xylophilus ampelinus]
MATRIVAPSGQTLATSPVNIVTLSAKHLLCSAESERIAAKLQQLNVLLMGMYGNGKEWLQSFASDDQDVLHWLASDLASEVHASWKAMHALAFPQVEARHG